MLSFAVAIIFFRSIFFFCFNDVLVSFLIVEGQYCLGSYQWENVYSPPKFLLHKVVGILFSWFLFLLLSYSNKVLVTECRLFIFLHWRTWFPCQKHTIMHALTYFKKGLIRDFQPQQIIYTIFIFNWTIFEE